MKWFALLQPVALFGLYGWLKYRERRSRIQRQVSKVAERLSPAPSFTHFDIYDRVGVVVYEGLVQPSLRCDAGVIPRLRVERVEGLT